MSFFFLYTKWAGSIIKARWCRGAHEVRWTSVLRGPERERRPNPSLATRTKKESERIPFFCSGSGLCSRTRDTTWCRGAHEVRGVLNVRGTFVQHRPKWNGDPRFCADGRGAKTKSLSLLHLSKKVVAFSKDLCYNVF